MRRRSSLTVRLSRVMRKLGWTNIRARGLSPGSYRDRVRGFAREVSCHRYQAIAKLLLVMMEKAMNGQWKKNRNGNWVLIAAGDLTATVYSTENGWVRYGTEPPTRSPDAWR